MTENTAEHWATSRLRELLASREVKLLAPSEHRDRWLEGLLQHPFRFRLAGDAKRPASERIEMGLDAAAGLLLELPRLERDAWAGWGDRRLTPIFQLLRMAELPPAPPRSAMAECWAELRSRVSFPWKRPSPGDPPRPLEDLIEPLQGYLSALTDEVEAVVHAGGALLGDRLRVEVERHVHWVRSRTLPLARDMYGALLPSQRLLTLLQNARGEQARKEEGRGLRARSHYRYSLAAWVLREVGLTREESGLFMRYVDPVGLTPNLEALSEEPKDEIWRTRLVKSVDNRLLSWETPVGRRGQGPLLGIENIESEMRDLLKPLMRSLPAECPPEVQEDPQPKH